MFNTIVTHIVSLIFLSSIAYFLSPHILDFFVKISAISVFLYVSYLLASFVDNVLPRFRVTAANKAVLITGCDSGFGHLLARRLDSIGFKVFAGCLNPNDEGATKLKDSSSSNLHVLKIDVTQDDSVLNALKVVENNLDGDDLWAVVNNAGVGESGELEWMPMEAYRKQFEVNTFGVVRVTKAFLPLLRKFRGRIVTTTSTGGRFTFSGYVPYCMSKYATNSFCEGLRLEMAKFGVKVITVEPLAYRTNMTNICAVLQSLKNNWNKAPEKLKQDIYNSDYINAFTNSVRKYHAFTANPHVHQVVDWLVDGVTAISPHYSYVPGDFKSLLLLWFLKRLPKTLADYLVRKEITFDCDVEQYLQSKMICVKKKII